MLIPDSNLHARRQPKTDKPPAQCLLWGKSVLCLGNSYFETTQLGIDPKNGEPAAVASDLTQEFQLAQRVSDIFNCWDVLVS